MSMRERIVKIADDIILARDAPRPLLVGMWKHRFAQQRGRNLIEAESDMTGLRDERAGGAESPAPRGTKSN